ncbi:MAG: hypothetical protein Tsb002_28730 [Wenzhouxiangellaceae bacterium]
MPIYEYQCAACEQRLERLQKVTDEPLTDCPQCGQPELRKLVSAAGFRLKGGGWYETDFKSGNQRNLVESGEAKKNGNSGAAKTGDDKQTSSKKEATTKSADASSGGSSTSTSTAKAGSGGQAAST